MVKESRDICKLLGVHLDKELRFKDQAREVAVKGLILALALEILRGLKTYTARRVYNATVAPIIEYAAPEWAPTVTNLVLTALEPIQHLVSASAVMEAEISIPPTQNLFFTQMMRAWIGMYTTPRQHPFRRLQKGLDPQSKGYKISSEITASECNNIPFKDIVTIILYSMPPWQARLEVMIEEEQNTAMQDAIIPCP